MIKKLRRTGASCVRATAPSPARASLRTCRAFPGALPTKPLKGLEGLLGKLVVEFADLLRLGNGGLVSPLHEFGVNRHRLVERPGAAELLDERSELLESISWCSRDRHSRWSARLTGAGSAVTARLCWFGECRLGQLTGSTAPVLPLQARLVQRAGSAGEGAAIRRRLGRRGDGTTGSSTAGCVDNRRVDDRRLIHLRALGVNRLRLQWLILIRALQLNRRRALWRAFLETVFLGCTLSCAARPYPCLRRPDFPAGLPSSVFDISFPSSQCQTKWQNSAMFTMELRFLLVGCKALAC